MSRDDLGNAAWTLMGNEMHMKHDLELVPQTTTDGWQAKCRCGWQNFKSFYEISDRDELLAELRLEHEAHIANGQ